MQIIYKNYDLTQFNTLGLFCIASNFITLDNINILAIIRQLVIEQNYSLLVLGGGSNIILPKIYDGLVVYNQLHGIYDVTNDLAINEVDICDENYVFIKAMAGVNWDEFVSYTLDNNYYGLENLSYIPGNIGASPIQNIGAYGAEVGNFIHSVEVYDVSSGSYYHLNRHECQFNYRNSIFKQKTNYIILNVIFKLSKQPQLNYKYKELNKYIERNFSNQVLTAHLIRQAVIAIRQNKLPDYKVIGNVGSFFHNPIINHELFMSLKIKYPNIVAHDIGDNLIKVSAGWLIDNLGLKGYKVNNVGIYKEHALIIVNYGYADSDDILEFAAIIQKKIKDTYGIDLQIEPQII